MLEVCVIRKSSSHWASVVVLLRKKNGSLRLCTDLRKLNTRVRYAYSLPRIDEIFDCLNGAKLLRALDLKSWYLEVDLYGASEPLTALTSGPFGFYECKRMSFGSKKAPATFERFIRSCLGDLHLNWCIIYLDDIIIFLKTLKEHLHRLRWVFEKLSKAGIRLNPANMSFSEPIYITPIYITQCTWFPKMV